MSRAGAGAITIEIEGRIRVDVAAAGAVEVWCTGCRAWLAIGAFTLSVLKRTPVCHDCRRRRAAATRPASVPQRRGRSGGWGW